MPTMIITVNGEQREVPDGLTVRGLIEHLGLTEGPVAVEQNREVVPRERHAQTNVSHGDVLEIVHFVGGG
jgi:sulfur carrier protein